MRYAELHCLSNYSFLQGASHPEELVRQAAAHGYHALALTDECSLAGIVKAHMAARETGLKLIVGTQIELQEGVRLVLLAPDRVAYGQVSTLITRGRRRSPKGRYLLTMDDLAPLHDCLALWVPARNGRDHELGSRMRACFPERLWIAAERFYEADDAIWLETLQALASKLQLPITAAGDVHMHHPERKPLHDCLTAIRLQQPLRALGRELQPNTERSLQPLSALQSRLPRTWLQASCDIADRCSFSIDTLRYEYPEELVPAGLNASQYLRQESEKGAWRRWPEGVPPRVEAQLERELGLIAELGYEYFFLTVYDIVQFARGQGILCQGRGSAANSTVCFCLGITEVDPSRQHTLFERFVSRERNEPPDIDVDFEHQRREEVIQYLYRRYGRQRAALAATLITYRGRSAVRDVGKALGLDRLQVDRLARSLAWWDDSVDMDERLAEAGLDAGSLVARQLIELTRALIGFPRHLSQHVGGFVISRGPLAELVPIENAAMPERTIIQWDKDDLEALGLLKVDVLALGMLSAIAHSFEEIQRFRGEALTLAEVPPEDPETYAMLQRGDSTGVFQVESRAQMAMLPRLRPACFYDLVIQVSIVRPGPIQGDMVHPYLRRRQGLEQVSYPSDAVRGVLERTLGVPIFQEQVIELAMVAAGFSGGEADALRRAMAAWRRRGGLESFRDKLIQGMLARGHDAAFAERLFAQICGFGEYGFPESHAASFALLVYVSAWLKRHEPAAFCCGLLNSLPMGFYSASQLIQDVRRHGIEVRPADVRYSDWRHTLEPSSQGPGPGSGPSPLGEHYSRQQGAIRLGLCQIAHLGEAAAQRILSARRTTCPDSVAELARRAQLNQRELNALAQAGALAGLAGHRHQAHWQVAAIQPAQPLWAEQSGRDDDSVMLAEPSTVQDMAADYASLGLTLGAHPMALLRAEAPFHRCRPANSLQTLSHGRFVRVAGLVTGRQRPGSARGVLFLTLEDETGNHNVVVWTHVLARYRPEILGGRLLLIKGTLEREGSVIHVVAGHVEDQSAALGALQTRSRDFH